MRLAEPLKDQIAMKHQLLTTPEATSRVDTFRTIREVLSETVRVFEAGALGLELLSKKPGLPERDQLMLKTLVAVRRGAAQKVWDLVDSAPHHGEDTWVQSAPVLSSCPDLAARIIDAGSGEQAAVLLCEADDAVERCLEGISRSSPVANPLLTQMKVLLGLLRKMSGHVVPSAQDC
jgi:hypothetical protein